MAILLLSLSACQTLPDSSKNEGVINSKWLNDARFFEDRLEQYQLMSRWRFSAKVGIKTPKAQEQANLVWRFADQSNDVRIFGPLGVGAIKIEFDQYGVQLSDKQGVLHRGESAEDLLTRIVGWPIPIDALSYWLFGLPSPGQVYEYQKTEFGVLETLRQHGWTVQYSSYRDYNGLTLARKFKATKSVTPDQTVSVKLITKNWQWL